MVGDTSLRDRLRRIPTVQPELPRFHNEAAPDDPMSLFLEWLDLAIEAGVDQPLAMSLATVSADGHPSNRTLIMKDADTESIWFSSLSSGPKGADLAANHEAAIVFYWREQGRQIRMVGTVEAGPRAVAERDFLQRQPNPRARAIAGRQSEPVEDFDAHLESAREIMSKDPDFVPEAWVAYRLFPASAEFWQAERERDQVRLRYLRTPNGWVKDLLWP